MKGVGIEVTTEELLALAALLGLPLPLTLRETPAAQWSAEVKKDIAAIGERSLLARGLVKSDPKEVPALLANAMETMCRPSGQLSMVTVRDGKLAATAFLTASEFVVGHRPQKNGNHQLTMIPIETLEEVVRSGIPAVVEPQPDTDVLHVSTDALAALNRRAQAGDVSPLSEEALVSLGVDPTGAADLASMLKNATAFGSIRALRIDAAGTRGYEFSWIESAGLWIFDQPSGRGGDAVLSRGSNESVGAHVSAAVGSILPD